MLFDNRKRKCLPKSRVECGTRFDPYEKIESSSAKSDQPTDLTSPSGFVSTLSSDPFHITDYSTSRESAQTGDDSISTKNSRTEYSSQQTMVHSHSTGKRIFSSDSTTFRSSKSPDDYSKTEDSSDTTIKNIPHFTGGFTSTPAKQIDTSDPIIEDHSRLTEGFTHTGSKRISSSYPSTEDHPRSSGGYTYTGSKRIGLSDPTIEDNSRSTGGSTYRDTKRIGSSDPTIEDNSHSTGGLTYTDSKRIGSSDPITKVILRFTGEFIPSNSKVNYSSDSAVKDVHSTREQYASTDPTRFKTGDISPSSSNNIKSTIGEASTKSTDFKSLGLSHSVAYTTKHSRDKRQVTTAPPTTEVLCNSTPKKLHGE